MRTAVVVGVLLLVSSCGLDGGLEGGLPSPGVTLPHGVQMPNADEETDGHPTHPLETPTADRTEHNSGGAESQEEEPRAVIPQTDCVPNGNQTSASRTASSAVHFLSPLPPISANPVLFRVNVEGPVARVRYQIHAIWSENVWTVGESVDSGGNFPLTISLDEGGIRTIRAQALNEALVVVAETSATLWIQGASSSGTENPPTSGSSSGNGSDTGDGGNAGSGCQPGEVIDCGYNCGKAAWINDGTCDDGTSGKPDFTCPALGMDGTDCGLQAQSFCAPGELIDCNGSCAKAAWVNDGICDDGSQYSTVFTCPELGNDGTDCAAGNGPAPAPPTIPTPSPQPTTGSSANVPYFYQYANTLHPGSSCQNTSIAMLLAHYGWGGKPDDITQQWGKNYAQSPSGLATVFNSYAKGMGIPQRLVPHTNGTLGAFRALLQSGKPTIVHAYMTQYGHVVLATGYNGQNYTLNDPAGQWNQQFKGGYPYGWNSTKGKGIQYGKAAFELSISSLSGSDFAPLWYHEIVD